MRQRNQTTVALAIGGILLALVFPWTLAAQEDKFIDCRERPCDVEDIVRALQPPPVRLHSRQGTVSRNPNDDESTSGGDPSGASCPRTAVALNVLLCHQFGSDRPQILH